MKIGLDLLFSLGIHFIYLSRVNNYFLLEIFKNIFGYKI